MPGNVSFTNSPKVFTNHTSKKLSLSLRRRTARVDPATLVSRSHPGRHSSLPLLQPWLSARHTQPDATRAHRSRHQHERHLRPAHLPAQHPPAHRALHPRLPRAHPALPLRWPGVFLGAWVRPAAGVHGGVQRALPKLRPGEQEGVV